MNKNIFCGIAWMEFFDYPMLRKLIKEELARDIKKIQISIPSNPGAFGKSEKDADEFLNWLQNDLSCCPNVTVNKFTINDVPEITKYSGNKTKGDLSLCYVYPIEYCFEKCDQEYFLRIETDFFTTDWRRIKKFIDETDFDLINTGCLENGPLDVSFWCLKMQAFNEYVTDKTFLNGNFYPYTDIQGLPQAMSRRMSSQDTDHLIASNINRQTDVLKRDHSYNYDHFQWMMFQIINKSDKVFVLNPKSVDIRHYISMNQSTAHYIRTNKFCALQDDKCFKYIETCKVHGLYENYNMYLPYKNVMDKYYEDYKLTENYNKYLEHYKNFKY